MSKINSSPPHPSSERDESLGKVLSQFPIRHRHLKRWLWLTVGILLALIGFLGASYLLITAWHSVQFHGWAVLIAQLPWVLLLALVILPLGIGLFLFAVRHWEDGIIVHEQGFIKNHKKRRKLWLWSEIEQLDTRIINSVFGGSEINSRIMITIEAQNHPPLKIVHKYKNMSELAQEIRKNSLPILYEKFLTEWNSKGETQFHKNLTLDRAGINFNGQELKWDEFDAVETQKGHLTIQTRNEEKNIIKIPLNQIQNLDLLLFILQNQRLRENFASLIL